MTTAGAKRGTNILVGVEKDTERLAVAETSTDNVEGAKTGTDCLAGARFEWESSSERIESRGPVAWSGNEIEICAVPIRLLVSRRLCNTQWRCKPGSLVSKRRRMRQYMMHDIIFEIQIDNLTGEIRGRRVQVVLLPRHPR